MFTAHRLVASTLARRGVSQLSTTVAPALPVRFFSAPKVADRTASVTYVNKDGTRTTCSGMYGENLMTIAHRNGIEMEGACEGSCACSTCHVIVSRDYYDKIPEATEEEDDMLDLAFGLTDTSRLGCQITLAPELDGIVVALPPATRNMAVDGHVAKPH